jgi:hypothetical protein
VRHRRGIASGATPFFPAALPDEEGPAKSFFNYSTILPRARQNVSTVFPRPNKGPQNLSTILPQFFHNFSTILLRLPHSMSQQFTLVRKQSFHGDFVEKL